VEKRLRAAPDVVRDSALNFTALATQTEGYSPTDLQDLVARAMHCAAIRGAERGRNADIEVTLFFFLTIGLILNCYQSHR
jgi:peroxin-1